MVDETGVVEVQEEQEERREFVAPEEENPYEALGIVLKDDEGNPVEPEAVPNEGEEKPDEDEEGEEKPDEKPEEKSDETPSGVDELCAAFAEKCGMETLEYVDAEGNNIQGADALMQFAEQGLALTRIGQRMNHSAESAEELLGELTAMAISLHGDDLRDEAIDPRSLNVNDMSPVERGLVGRVQALQHQLNAVSADREGALKVALERAAKLEAELHVFQNDPKLEEAVRTVYPEARISGPKLRELMEKHEVKNPVKAYQLEALETNKNPKRDQIVKAAKIVPEAAKTYDPSFNPKTKEPYTFSEMMALSAQGYEPETTKK